MSLSHKNKNKSWFGRGPRHALGRTPRQASHPTPSSLRRAKYASGSPRRLNMTEAGDAAAAHAAGASASEDDDGDDDEGSAAVFGLGHHHHTHAHTHHHHADADASAACGASVCVRQTVPSHAMFALTRIQSLLQYVGAGALVALDIDDTLVRRRRPACALLTAEGARAFHVHVASALASAPFAEKQRLVNALHAEVKAFTLAEDDTAAVVRALQDRGARVFGLTARAPAMAAATHATLAGLGIDLARTAPASLPARAVDAATGAAVVGGVVYCGETDKGVVFQRLLQQGWVAWPADAADAAAAAAGLPPGTHATSEDGEGRGCPERTVWFVDDSLAMIQGMAGAWAQMARAQQAMLAAMSGEWAQRVPCRGRLALVCCHYTHPTAAATAAAAACIPSSPAVSAAILQREIELFAAAGELVTDAEAYRALVEDGTLPAAGAGADADSAADCADEARADAGQQQQQQAAAVVA